jgi:hypothetical protein
MMNCQNPDDTDLNLFGGFFSNTTDAENFKWLVLLLLIQGNNHDMQRRITNQSNHVKDLKFQLRIVIGLENQAKKFFVLRLYKEIESLVKLIESFASFPMWHKAEIKFLQYI